jgi:hypothetical protein
MSPLEEIAKPRCPYLDKTLCLQSSSIVQKNTAKKKSLIPIKVGIQGLHPAQLDPLMSGKYLVPRNKDLFENPCGIRQVFWLTDLSTRHPFPTGSPGQWLTMAFVPVYSGGTATASHRLPF